MPRRKGISHKQRSAQNKQPETQPQTQLETQQPSSDAKKRKAVPVIHNDDPMGNGLHPHQRLAPSLQQDGGNKYLHKKFKKMAEVEEAANAANAIEELFQQATAPSPMVNGHVPATVAGTASPVKTAGESTKEPRSPQESVGRYVCPYCTLSCSKPSVLEKHIRAHTNERPFPCQPCGFAFKTKSNLYKHCRSRAHTIKMEEEGADPSKFPQLPPLGAEPADGEVSSDDGDAMAASLPVATPSSSLPGEMPEAAPRNIYKPKFHPAALHYLDENNALAEKENSNYPRREESSLSLQTAVGPGGLSKTGGGDLSKPPGSPFGSTSPEFIQRRISKIISENQAIVETSDSFWPKKYLQKQSSRSLENSAPSSPLPSSPTPGSEAGACPWPKKFHYRQMNSGPVDPHSPPQHQSEAERNSKLALALLRPKCAPSPPLQPIPAPAIAPSAQPLPLLVRPIPNPAQAQVDAPLNLSKPFREPEPNPVGTLDLTQPNRKRSFTEENKKSNQPRPVLRDQPILPSTANSQHLLVEHQDSAFKRVPPYSPALDMHHQVVEGSVIKDILLKSRAAGLGPGYLPYIQYDPSLHPGLPVQTLEDSNPFLLPNHTHSCPSCKMQFRSADMLKNHRAYHCCRPVVSDVGQAISLRAPTASPMDPPTGYPSSPNRLTSVVPPQPSPGPLLGNTPLVESYNNRDPPPLKKRRVDSGGHAVEARELRASPCSFSASSSPMVTTLRSLEELSKCPMRTNSLQMFGGQVQILDNAGETKTLRIETSSRGPPSGLNLGMQHPERSVTPTMDTNRTSTNASPQQMVVTISKSGLQSGGGTIVQVSMSETQASRGIDPKSKSPFSSSSVMPSCTTLTDATRLLIPLMPTINTPNLAIPGIPTPTHMPFMSFSSSVMSDGSLLNPLTSITAFNPLTLAAQPSTPRQSSPTPAQNKLTPLPAAVPAPSPVVPPTPTQPRALPPPASVPTEVSIPVPCPEFSPIPATATAPNAVQVSAPALPPVQTPSPAISSSQTSSYGGGVLTIVHGGRAIPHVPGMPGPATQVHMPGPAPAPAPAPSTRLVPHVPGIPGPGSTQSTSQSKRTILSSKDSSRPRPVQPVLPLPSLAPVIAQPAEKRNFHMFSPEAMAREQAEASLVPTTQREPSPIHHPTPAAVDVIVSAPEDKPPVSPNALKVKRPRLESSRTLSPLGIDNADGNDKRIKISSPSEVQDTEVKDSHKDEPDCAVTSAQIENKQGNRFLRPTSLPLKPGTFTPKRLLITPNVLSLVSPETPRPRKSYGQLYLNGHAYTYLGLKCSTRPFFCTLNRLQPTYVPLSPDHNKLSMYSNWKVYDPDPDPCGLGPGQVIALYDSRHRPCEYTVAEAKNSLRLTHSSYWLNRDKKDSDGVQEASDEVSDAPKRVKIFDGGFESNEEYTYIRGRGRGRYVCEECGIRCKKPSMLKKHIRTHTDVRPFTCRHCSFSFKTKGNLTKHMKSKAHYKKCVEMGILPVPTVVDESYIDEEILARQQALRAGRGEGEGEDSEDVEEDEEDEDDDDDDEEEEEEDADDDIKGRQEREAARSLLSLSQTPHLSPNTEREAREAGLMAPKGTRGLSTYPYKLSVEHPRRITPSVPGTPTLSAISEHREREKVSHNTGLARDIHEQAVPTEDSSKPLAELNLGDGHQRYYFPSSRAFGGTSSSASDLIKEESADVSVDSTNGDDNTTKSKVSVALSILPVPATPARTPTTPISEILTPVSEPAYLLASLCSTMEKLPVSLGTPTDPHQDSALLQTYLRERAVQDARVKQSQYYPRHSKQASTSAPSTPGTPVTPTIPQLTSSSIFSHTITVSQSDCGRSLTTTTFTSISQMISSIAVSQESATSRLPQPPPPPPPLVWATQKVPKVLEIDTQTPNGNSSEVVLPSGGSGLSTSVNSATSTLPTPVVKQEYRQPSLDAPPPPGAAASLRSRSNLEADASEQLGQPLENAIPSNIKPEVSSSVCSSNQSNSIPSDISVVPTTGSDVHSDAIPTVPVASTGPSSGVIVSASDPSPPPPPPPNPNIPSKKPKAEFMPPNSGPAMSYFSVTDDGRNMCTACNKVFTKPSQLRLHVNIHYFERPFRCDACVVSFRTRGHLQKHERSDAHHNKVRMNSTFGTPTTDNPRPFKCDDCKIAFRIHGHLAKHLRSKMHIMKLECEGKLPFGTYAEMERNTNYMNRIDTSDCENSLVSLLALAQELCEKDPTKLNHWKQPETTASDVDESSDEGEPIPFHGLPFQDVDTGDEDNAPPSAQEASIQPLSQSQSTSSVAQTSPVQVQQSQQQQLQTQSLPQTQHVHPGGKPEGIVAAVSSASTLRTSGTAAAAAAAAAVVAAAAVHLPPRLFYNMPTGSPPPGSNGIPHYLPPPPSLKLDASADKTTSFSASGVPLTSYPKDNTTVNNNINYSFSEPWRFGPPNSRVILLSSEKSESEERRLGLSESGSSLDEKTVDMKTSSSRLCTSNKTEGGQKSANSTIQPPTNR